MQKKDITMTSRLSSILAASTLLAAPLIGHDEHTIYGFVEPLHGAQRVEVKAGRRVTETYVKEGETVKAGQLLAKLDCQEETLECNIIKAKADVVRVGLENAEDTLRRQEELFAKDVISEHEVTQSRLNRDAAAARFEVCKRELELAEYKLRDFDVSAPKDGKLYRFALKVNAIVPEADPIVIGAPQLGVRLWANPMKCLGLCDAQDLHIHLACASHQATSFKGHILRRSLLLLDDNPAAPTTEKGERFQELVVALEDSEATLPIGVVVTAHPIEEVASAPSLESIEDNL